VDTFLTKPKDFSIAMLIDLASTGQRLRNGTSTALPERGQCLEVAMSTACDHALARLLPDAERTTAVQNNLDRLRSAAGTVIGRTNMLAFVFSDVNPHIGPPAARDGRFGAPPGTPRVPRGIFFGCSRFGGHRCTSILKFPSSSEASAGIMKVNTTRRCNDARRVFLAVP
jgi:hypothetical protein